MAHNDFYAYPAVFYYDPDGISIEFPDLPGCLPCATTTEAAFHNAREALGLHLFGMEQDNDPIPAPTPAQALHPENGGVVTLIDVYMPSIRMAAGAAEYIYPAVFHPNTDGTFTVTFPDLPGCISEGKSLGNAMSMAQDALTQWIGYLQTEKQPVPPASAPQSVTTEGEEFVTLIRVGFCRNL